MKHLWVTFLALLLALPAAAAPTKLAQQGRVLDGDGAPLEGNHSMLFVLYDAATDGNALWTEERVGDFAGGYYSITLGEQVPLADLLFTAESVWLELSIGGETLAPRQEVVSVPYALRTTAAEHVEGGMVDAAEISVDGTVVIDASGAWVGPPLSVNWADVADIPADIADGDQDEDTLAGLACAEGQLPKWDAAGSLWVCSDDIDTTDPNTDTLFGLPCADGYIAKFDGPSGLWDCALDADSFADLAGVCFPGDIPVLDPVSGTWICGADMDTDTHLTDAQVAAAATAEGFVTGAHTVDTNTQLTEGQVDAYVANNNYSTGAHTIDTNTQLSEAQVEDFVTDGPVNLAVGSTVAGLPITTGAAVPSGVIVMWSGAISALPAGWALCDGLSGTPNLLDRFIVSVSSSSIDPGGTGGANSHDLSHDHAYSGSTSSVAPVGCGSCANSTAPPNYAGGHSHGYSGQTSVGGGASVDLRPSYYQLAFIMKL